MDFNKTELLVPSEKVDIDKLAFCKGNLIEGKTSIKKKITWRQFDTIKLCREPRFLIVEDNWIGKIQIKDSLRILSSNFIIDSAGDGVEALEKFENLFHKGYMFDCIIMDIDLPKMCGDLVTTKIRNYEKKYDNVRTNVVAATVESNFEMDKNLFDNLCKY